jgi:hypothetical protein
VTRPPLDYASPETTPGEVPAGVRAVAAVFVAFGVLTLLDTVLKLAAGRVWIEFGLLQLFVGPNLLRRSRGWRTCGLVFCWLSFVGGPVLVAIALFGGGRPMSNLPGLRDPDLIRLAIVAWAVGGFAVAVWQYRVLTRPDVRRWFGLPPRGDG